MSWRTVIITKRCKLDLKMGYMVVRGEEVRRIYLDEIAMLIIENPAVSLTGCLLEGLVSQKVRVVFCDAKRSPMAELVPYYGAHDSARKVKTQMSWNHDFKCLVWAEIVAEKIRKQAEFLDELGKAREAALLREYVGQVEPHDKTNREGHAAKVYFNGLFGMGFTRSAETVINAALNYGYAILLSAFNREITACGYLTQLGIFHDNMFNHYNLSSDLMEPFRVLVDRLVYAADIDAFDSVQKHALWELLNSRLMISNTSQTVLNAVTIYTRSVFDTLNDKDLSKLRFFQIVRDEL
ncbi:MAG: type II CRISPR-associated endonuclease Cas1 [Clostridia bacterium]|nr:type II CRISPR-associated endonuclease Cas1 [Clostridia bacterium]